MMSTGETYKGKRMDAGKRTVRTGIVRIMFDGCCWSSSQASFVLSSIVVEVRKRAHSARMLVRLIISMPRPYQLVVMGHISCVWPVRKSPMRMCWVRATK